MMIVALPFAHFQRRQGGVGFRIFAGTMLGLAFFLIGRLFSSLGVLNDWPPLISATLPLVIFTGVAVGDAVLDRAALDGGRVPDRRPKTKAPDVRGLSSCARERRYAALRRRRRRRSRTCAAARP